MKPRPHQTAAVEAVLKTYRSNNRAQLRMACGTGKTYVAALIKQRIPSAVTVFFAPSIYLVHQAYAAWRVQLRALGTVLSICSKDDTTIDEQAIEEIGQNVTVSTKAEAIQASLLVANTLTIFCTYRSAPKLIAALKRLDRTVDFAVCDEAHNIAGHKDKAAQSVLRDLKAEKMLFLTATPRLANLHNVVGMNDEEAFGPIAYTMGFGSAVENDILCPYHIQISVAINSEHVDPDAHNRYVAVKALNEAKSRGFTRGLTFHNKTAAARRFRALLQRQLPSVPAYALDFRCSLKERNTAINAVKAHGGVIANVSILGEGFDFPELDHLVIVDPKSSVVDITQNVGRIMRKSPGKTEARAIIPISLSPDAMIDAAKERIVNVVKAIAMHDETLAAIITNLQYGRESNEDFLAALNNLVSVEGVDEEISEAIKTKVRHSVLNLFVGKKVNHLARLSELKRFAEVHRRMPSQGATESQEEMTLVSWMTNLPQVRFSASKRAFIDKIMAEIGLIRHEYRMVSYRDLLEQCSVRCSIQKGQAERNSLLRELRRKVGVSPVRVSSIERSGKRLWFCAKDFEKAKKYFEKKRRQLLTTHVLVGSFAGKGTDISLCQFGVATKTLKVKPVTVLWFQPTELYGRARLPKPNFVTKSEAARIIEYVNKLKAHTRKSGERRAHVRRLLKTGLPLGDIAKKLGIQQALVERQIGAMKAA